MSNYRFKPVNLDSVKSIMNSKGIYDKKDIKPFTMFNRLGYFDQYNMISEPKEYVFFTKPDFNIFSGGNTSTLNPQLADDFFEFCLTRYPDVLKSLQLSINGNNSPFINILTDKVRSKLDMPSISAGDSETASNIFGDTLTYRKGSGSSYNKHSFSLDFDDTRYLDVYMFFKIWEEYVDKKYKGLITPPKKSYTLNKILHDVVSAYKFIVDEDGETIIFFAKLWGVYPKEVPLNTFSSLDTGIIRHTVEFHSEWVEDMKPLIIDEFNILGNGYSGENSPLYDSKISAVSGQWVKMPYIEKGKREGREVYLLKWRV